MSSVKKKQDSFSDLRRQAEQRLAGSKVELEQLSAEEVVDLIHELQVHQIELEMQNEELRRSEQNYQSLYESFVNLYDFAPFGYLVLKKPDFITAANLNAAKMLGSNRPTLIGHRFTDFITSQEQDKCFLFLRTLFDSGEPNCCNLNLRPSPNEAINVKIEAYPERDANGEPVFCRLAMTDITELKQKEAKLQQALTKFEEAQAQLIQQERLAAVGQLAAGVAHDFNNILTVILGHAELMRISSELAESIEKDVQPIIQASNRAVSLVKQILDFSQKTVQHKKQGDLISFFRELLQFLKQTIPESIQISLNVESGQYWVEADFTQLQQLFANLVINARDAMPQGGQLSIILSQTSMESAEPKIFFDDDQYLTGTWICVEIKDTGCGISSEHSSRIFEPFFTTKNDVAQGVGLGLSQVYGIIKQHGWHISVDSEKNQGTTFKIYLPLAAPYQNVGKEQNNFVLKGNKQKILLVEDEPNVLAINTTLLERLNYKVITARDGAEALQAYQEHKVKIDLVISDMVMPTMDGEMLFYALKAQNPNVKVILISGYPLKEQGTKLIEQGLVDWLQKPISFQQLSQIVDKALSEI